MGNCTHKQRQLTGVVDLGEKEIVQMFKGQEQTFTMSRMTRRYSLRYTCSCCGKIYYTQSYRILMSPAATAEVDFFMQDRRFTEGQNRVRDQTYIQSDVAQVAKESQVAQVAQLAQESQVTHVVHDVDGDNQDQQPLILF